LEEAIGHHPHVATLQNNLAVLLERQGRYEDALHAAERGLSDDPHLAQLHKNIGDLCFRANRPEEALDAYARAVQADPQLGDDVYLKLGTLHMARREREQAVHYWERALELDPTNVAVRKNLETAGRR
jgi:tetratricopeptide (TPR) repeat protein